MLEKHARTINGMQPDLFPKTLKKLVNQSIQKAIHGSLTASFQILDFLCVLINDDARHKNAAVAKAIDQQLQGPSIVQWMLFDQLG